MKLSIYTTVKNGIYLDYHVAAMLKHHLPLADEIVVNEGFSTDGTLEAISNIDPKIKIFQTDWGKPDGQQWLVRFKEAAKQRCTGDWCILLDCDEFIPEWEFDVIRDVLTHTDRHLYPVNFINFYGNHRTVHALPRKVGWPARKMIIHRNIPEVEIWGDGSNVRIGPSQSPWDSPIWFTVHHFGFVRNAARLREKWRNLLTQVYFPGKHFRIPSFLFDLWPHNWQDPQFLHDLALYEGKDVKAVREDPTEFVRDNWVLFHQLSQDRETRNARSSTGG